MPNLFPCSLLALTLKNFKGTFMEKSVRGKQCYLLTMYILSCMVSVLSTKYSFAAHRIGCDFRKGATPITAALPANTLSLVKLQQNILLFKHLQSRPCPITCGVPQGLILGTFLSSFIYFPTVLFSGNKLFKCTANLTTPSCTCLLYPLLYILPLSYLFIRYLR